MTEENQSSHGGKRPGAGRRPQFGETMKSGIYIRCSEEQKDAMSKYVAGLSASLEAEGRGSISFSTWLRELGLVHSGNAHLGTYADMRQYADSMEEDVADDGAEE